MKKNLLLGLLLIGGTTFAQILHEPFDYTVGETLTGQVLTDVGTWTNYSGSTPDDILIVEEPIWSDFGIPTPSGAAANWRGGGSDLNITFEEVNSGVIYYSALLQVDQYNTAGVHDPYRQIHLQNGTGNTGPSIYFDGVDGDDTKFMIGANASDSGDDTVWSTETYDIGSQHFVVVSYDLDDDEKTMKMWIDPVVSATEPMADITSIPSEKLRNEIVSIAIQGSSNARNPETTVDELRVATSWEEVVGANGATASTDDVFASKFSVYPNPATSKVAINSSDTELTSLQVFNTLGKTVYASEVINTIDVSSFPKGVYFLKLNGKDGASVTKKLIIE